MTSAQQDPATPGTQDAPASRAQDAPAAPPASSKEAEAIRTAYGFEGARLSLIHISEPTRPY